MMSERDEKAYVQCRSDALQARTRLATEQERFTQWYDGLKKKRMGLFSRHCANTAWLERAQIAAERERELVGALDEIAYSTLTGQEAGRIARNALAKHEQESQDE